MDDPFSKKGTKLFGAQAQRVTNEEVQTIFAEIAALLPDFRLSLVRSLASKPDHGDIDILAVPDRPCEILPLLNARFGDRVVAFSKNSYIHSWLYASRYGKTVHVDLIVCEAETVKTRSDYYAHNDFAALVGVVAKNCNFKWGCQGFFKRFQDKRTIWRDILITVDLMAGLRVLGYEDAETRFNAIQNHDDIVNFIGSSPLFDSRDFLPDELRAVDRQAAAKRPGTEYVRSRLVALQKPKQIEQMDHFFETLFPEQYAATEQQKIEINERVYVPSSRYNGHWLMQEFDLKPGPSLGQLLKKMSAVPDLENLPSEEVKEHVRRLIGET